MAIYIQKSVFLAKESSDGRVHRVFGRMAAAEEFVSGKPNLVIDEWPTEFELGTMTDIELIDTYAKAANVAPGPLFIPERIAALRAVVDAQIRKQVQS